MAHGYIGTPGALVKFRCPSSLSNVYTLPGNERVTTGGRMVSQEAPRGHRVWSVTADWADNQAIADLEALAARVYGRPPWVWADPDAQITNMLTPEATAFGPGNTWAGGLITATATDGRTVRTISGTGAVVYGEALILPGQPVTLGVYGTGTMTLKAEWLTGTKTVITSKTLTQAVTGLARVTMTETAPTNAAWVRLTATGTAHGGPSVTWTDKPTPMTLGHGAHSVTIRGFERAVRAAANVPWLQRSDVKFDVVEVG